MADALSRLEIPDYEEPQTSEINNNEQILAEEDEEFPLALDIISKHQQKDREIRNLTRETGFYKKQVDSVPIIYTEEGKIVIPPSLQDRVVDWYHHFLLHPGASKMESTIRQKLWCKGMSQDIKDHVKECITCSKK